LFQQPYSTQPFSDYFIHAQRRVTESPQREEEFRRRQDEERNRIHTEHQRRLEAAQRERERLVIWLLL
jgi:hypothetical protein